MYTINNDLSIDRQIEEYLKKITDKIFENIPKRLISSIFLAGSFGKGEGGVLISNKKVFPVNDFDITIFPKISISLFKRDYTEILNELSETLLNDVPIKQIDLGIGDKRKFIIRAFKPFFTINAYEFIHGHHALYGKSNVKLLQHFYKPSKISIADGVKYLYTRGSGLLIPLLDYSQKSNVINKLNTYIEINKARLAIGDSYLIRLKKYHYSYQKRIEIAQKLSFDKLENGNDLKRLYISALSWKLKPTELSEININSELKSTIHIFLQYSLWYESQRMKKEFHSVFEYVNYKLDLCSHSKSERKLYDLSKSLYLLSVYISKENYNASFNKNLFSIHKNDPDMHHWGYLTKEYLNEFHPGGIVKQLITS